MTTLPVQSRTLDQIPSAPQVAVVFPGLGAQHIGMGRSWYEASQRYRDTLHEASDVAGRDLAELCFSPDAREELETERGAQIALFITSVAMFRALTEYLPVRIRYCAGHSLGEYSALCCAGILRLDAAVALVRERSVLIEETAKFVSGKMIWAINMSVEEVEAVCALHRTKGGAVFISSYNADYQCTVSGHSDAVDNVTLELERRGGIAYPLPFAGPYHCPLMDPAAAAMKSLLDRYDFAPASCSILSNYDGEPFSESSPRHALAMQLNHPIQWLSIQRRLYEQGVGVVIEVGPKNILTHLLSRTAPSIRVLAVEHYEHPARLVEDLWLKHPVVANLAERGCAIVSTTKSRLADHERYDEVVLAYRQLQALCGSLDGEAGREATVERVLELVERILSTKHVPVAERRRKINEMLDGRIFWPHEL